MSKYLFVIILFFAFFPLHNADARGMKNAKIMVIYAYADWCPNCRILSPILKEAIEKNDLLRKDVLFVTLDLTDKARIHQSVMLAQALGIGEFLKEQGSATGYIAILAAESHEERARFDRTVSAKEISDKILSFIK